MDGTIFLINSSLIQFKFKFLSIKARGEALSCGRTRIKLRASRAGSQADEDEFRPGVKCSGCQGLQHRAGSISLPAARVYAVCGEISYGTNGFHARVRASLL
uniref:Uncharacterized protein n=1 Tax=Cacopsylla melanoneura TaxID=428564 RepID=A0A8D8Y6P0_9HEMI